MCRSTSTLGVVLPLSHVRPGVVSQWIESARVKQAAGFFAYLQRRRKRNGMVVHKVVSSEIMSSAGALQSAQPTTNNWPRCTSLLQAPSMTMAFMGCCSTHTMDPRRPAEKSNAVWLSSQAILTGLAGPAGPSCTLTTGTYGASHGCCQDRRTDEERVRQTDEERVRQTGEENVNMA